MFLILLLHLHRIQDKNTEVVEKIGSTSPFKGPWFYNMDILSNNDVVNVHSKMKISINTDISNGNFSINFPKGSEFTKIFDVFGNGIFNLDAESWRNQRKLAQIDNKPCAVAKACSDS
ncbi:hypothetical protein PVL29_027055 [Vitis rotundifolia]|uniref:Uncharacterized protein n=1 Tax=Vitis rotundifolia TaxID=103349 RepID=A0AA39D6D3_VITRO|nr:hypothetical protein PVL29_027055 [Vitis rotundifolia]